jgi:hypothetical protein
MVHCLYKVMLCKLFRVAHYIYAAHNPQPQVLHKPMVYVANK